jgi:hypothetical protein
MHRGVLFDLSAADTLDAGAALVDVFEGRHVGN